MSPNELCPIPYVVEGVQELEDDDPLRITSSSSSCSSCLFPQIIQPETPREPMEFLCRSWSVSASEITKTLTRRPKQVVVVEETDSDTGSLPDSTPLAAQQSVKIASATHARKTGAFGKWFHHKELSVVKKKDRARVENARIHSAVSVAALATAAASAAASTSENNSDGSSSKMIAALALATELLATHCIELAETAGADHDRLISAVRSAVDLRGPSDLMTLTAAAATALRGEAALRARLPKEPKKNAAISPCERVSGVSETHEYESGYDGKTGQHCPASNTEEQTDTCVGELLQCSQNGVLRWKHLSVYINKKSQVIIKLKSKHVRGAFSMKNKGVVYEIYEENPTWPGSQKRGNAEEFFFGLKTAKGIVEFKCKNKAEKQKWVDGIRYLLLQVISPDASEPSLKSVCSNSSI